METDRSSYRFPPETRAQIAALAKLRGLNATNLLRLLVADAYHAAEASKQPKKKLPAAGLSPNH